jgi:hypothetical protein
MPDEDGVLYVLTMTENRVRGTGAVGPLTAIQDVGTGATDGDSGIAVPSSALDSAAGSTTTAARRYAITTLDPALRNPLAGSTKIPLPIIAPILIISVGSSPRLRSRSLLPIAAEYIFNNKVYLDSKMVRF